MNRSLTLTPVVALDSLFEEGELVAFDAGPDGAVYLVIALGAVDLRFVASSGASFPKSRPARSQTYRVIGLSGNQPILDLVIKDEKFNIHHVQPLPGELLLVSCRSQHRGPNRFERNGRVYSLTGEFAREILLGDGINSVQATESGVIWTSFFDEGIFGNFGWENPVGASGLVAWASDGNKLYDFAPTFGLERMCDCYALNVASEEDVWCYYYTKFPLVRLCSRVIDSIWDMPVKGSSCFAIHAGHVLFRGGYDDSDTYHLFTLGPNRKAKLEAKIVLRNEDGKELIADRAVGRAEAVHLLSKGLLYRLDVKSAIGA